jgi:hypothetical protein
LDASLLAADVVLIVHTMFIAFVIVGLIVIWIGYFRSWRWTRSVVFRVAHLTAIVLVVIQSFAGWSCPLTDLENYLRIRGGEDPYGDTGCIAYWLHRMIFWTAPPWLFTVCYTAFGVLVVATLILAPPRWGRRRLEPAR